MFTRNWLYCLVLPLLLCIVSCSKESRGPQEQSDNYLITEVQRWYATTSHTTGEPNWSDAKITTDQKSQRQIVVSYPLKNGVYGGNRTIRQMIFNKRGSAFEGHVLLIIADSTYGANNNGFNPLDFTGQVSTYDLSRKFISGGYYEKGVLRHKSVFETYKDRKAFENRIQTEMQCNYYQYSYMDDDGVFTVVGYTVCTPDQGGSGELPAIDHWDPSDLGGGGEITIDYLPATLPAPINVEGSLKAIPCPASYNFVKQGNWQSAVITGYYAVLKNDAGNGLMYTLDIGTIEVGMPSVTFNGTVIQAQIAQGIATQAALFAEHQVMGVVSAMVIANPSITPEMILHNPRLINMFKEVYMQEIDNLLRPDYDYSSSARPSRVGTNPQNFSLTDPSQYRTFKFRGRDC